MDGRRCRLIAATLLVAAAAMGADKAAAPAPPCLTAASTDCGVAAGEMKLARDLFRRGVRLHSYGNREAALDAFQQASGLVPRNVEFAAARELERQALVLDHVQRGNRAREQGRDIEAEAEFRAALALDPQNAFAASQLQAVVPPAPEAAALRRVAESVAVRLQPQPGPRELHLRGDTQSVVTQTLKAFGIDVVLDPAVISRPLRFDIGDADFATVLAALEHATHTFVVPEGPRAAHVFPDTNEARRDREPLILETFYLSDTISTQEMNDIVSAFRVLFDVRFMTPAPQQHAITVRAPRRIVDAAAEWLEQLQQGPPQVMLDVRFYEVSRTALRELGVNLPLQFQMFNATTAALTLGQGNTQDLINQLFTSGGINQANTQALQGLLGQLQNQQNSIFNTPFATFGGGLTRMGLVIPPATVSALFNSSEVRTLEHFMLRAMHNAPATFQVGSRYPILNATFAPIFNTSAISQVIQNNSFQTPFPSFNYENLGVDVKATPAIHGDGDVTLKLELEIKTLTGEAFNGVPVIATRTYNGSMTLKEGEAGFVAGSLTRSDQRNLSGLPGLGRLPTVGRLFSSEHKEHDEDELLISITPRLLSLPPQNGGLIMLTR